MAVIRRLPRGAGVVYRPFGAPDAATTGRRLAREAHRRGLVFLVGSDAALAALVGADGVHLPERSAWRAGAVKRARPRWRVTCAAHSRAAIASARAARVEAVFVSPVFASASPSAGRPLGPVRFACLVAGAGLPVFALGGINASTARRLAGSRAAGLAAVDGLLART
jgi:thiamine-phosphate pyrophosphorylase